jgi:hypothetical protein
MYGLEPVGLNQAPLSHARTFGLLRTHVTAARALGGDVDRDRATLLDALRAGSAWLHCPFVAPGEGARLWADCADGTTSPGRRRQLLVRRPPTAPSAGGRHPGVLRDGLPCHAVRSDRLDIAAETSGAYRVEARIGDRLWLLSNPVHLQAPEKAR